MSNRESNKVLSGLYQLLGRRTVLLPIPLKTKRPVEAGWESITFEDTQKPDYQAALQTAIERKGNIGVKLDDGLISIDFDDEETANAIASLAVFSETLRTRGRRGCNFWLRLVGSYPNGRNYPYGQNYYNLKRNGKKVGEFRCGPGAQTVIFGEHPDSTPENPIRYSSIASKSVIEIRDYLQP